MITVEVTRSPIDVAAWLAATEAPGAGAVASFTGVVRADDGVIALTLEHYPGMTERSLEELAAEAVARFGLSAVTIVHRVGPMAPGDRVVFVGCAATHRRQALDGCAMLIDRLKTDAPFWKHEVRGDGARWVGARDSDGQAADRWR